MPAITFVVSNLNLQMPTTLVKTSQSGHLRKSGPKVHFAKLLIFYLLKSLGMLFNVIRVYLYCPPLPQAMLIVLKQDLNA